MITFFTGLPRTGKSYRGVWYIQKNFIDHTSSNFNERQYCWTNIGGFKFDQINDSLLPFPLDPDKSEYFKANPELIKQDDNYTKETIYLDWKVFYPHIEKLHSMALEDKPDLDLLRYARYHKLSPALIVIDETYRFYTKKVDPVLVWLNGYHGHLGLDIIFIIHRPTLMASDYCGHTEEFINAQAKSKQLNNSTLKYFYHDSPLYTKENNYDKHTLTADPEIFALYKSGDMHKPKKIIYKYIGYALGAVAFIIFVTYLFMGRMNERIHTEGVPVAPASVNPNDPVIATPKSSVATSLLLRVRCNDAFCCRVDPSFQTNYIPKLYFEEILKLIDFKELAGSTITIFGDDYNDKLYSIPADSITFFSMWNIPISNALSTPQPVFNSVTGGTP